MGNSSSPVRSSANLESLMRASQQLMKQLADVIVAANGIGGGRATGQGARIQCQAVAGFF
jgi:hypothetical protein